MPDPDQNIPADRPLGWSDCAFHFRAFGRAASPTMGIGAMVQLAGQMQRPFEGVQAAVSMIADIHPTSTDRAIAVKDVELDVREIRVCGPMVRHSFSLHAGVRFIPGGNNGEG